MSDEPKDVMVSPTVIKYLRQRPLPGPWRIDGIDRYDFSGAVVIPALAETWHLFATLESLAANPPELLEDFLVLVVVNNRQDASSEDKEDNLLTLLRLESGDVPKRLHLARVDAASPGLELPAGEGVGLARKIGFDLALSRLDFGGGPPILASLDADTLVDPGYLPALVRHFSAHAKGGAVIPFHHQEGRNEDEQDAIERYELYLRHYVLGLELSGSPYAFHTVGSALACRAEAYAAAGGMNRRKAGEDFYFLQQLAKTCGVSRLSGTLLAPSARPSLRVPFGTGRSVARQVAGENDALRFYPARCFRILGDWLALAERDLFAENQALMGGARDIAPELAAFLQQAGFEEAWSGIRRNHRGHRQRLAAFHGWFDGLRTLRLVRRLSAGAPLPTAPEEVLPELLEWAGLHSPSQQKDTLALLRNHQ